MNQTNMGRAMTQAILRNRPDEISHFAPTKEWAKKARCVILPVPDDREKGGQHVLKQNDHVNLTGMTTIDKGSVNEPLAD
jgi:hypothetical protein